MKLLDLFSGIGGFSLAAQWVWGKELEIVGFVEIDEYCHRVLTKNFRGVPIFSDIMEYRPGNIHVDLVCGGFPCQDISIAGKGKGIDGERSGLWSEFKRIISEVRPKFALIENVPMLIHRGLGRVLSDLAEIGYNAEWQCISAAEVGAWHKRERIWIVAYPKCWQSRSRDNRESIQKKQLEIGPVCSNVPNTKSNGTQKGPGIFEQGDRKIPNSERFTGRQGDVWGNLSQKYDRQIGKERNDQQRGGEIDELWRWWQSEPELGRVAHGISNRVDRLKCLGNAIVPQVAYIIMRNIKVALDEFLS